MATESNKAKLRAVSYCRTSGEGQRDNTSIPRQKEDNERFIAAQGWELVRHYVDESISGSKVEGREDFLQMMRDAAKDQFAVIVAWDIARFARDGCDIVNNAKFLKTNYGVHVVDGKGQFDSRDHRRTLTNFVQAGVAEDERLRIMERCIGGRIRRAKEGKPWSPKLPVGRSYRSGEWFVTEQGEQLAKLLQRYADGESLKVLAPEYGFSSSHVVNRYIRQGQLCGTYQARFCAPEIGIGRRDAKHKRRSLESVSIPVPAVPQVITPELMERVRDRMRHNMTWNQQTKRQYLLTGFVTCGYCGYMLSAQTNRGVLYYRHSSRHLSEHKPDCPFRSIRGDVLEASVLDYLYGFFLDEPSFKEAIIAALPSGDDRNALQQDIKAGERRLAEVDRKIANFVAAIEDGADVRLLLDRQNELKVEKQVLETRLNELRQTLAVMPDPEHVEQEAMGLRFRLMQEHTGRDWRNLPYEEVRRFLHFVFGTDPRKTDAGIFVRLEKDTWHLTFKGNVEFHHDIVNDRPISHLLQIEADRLNRQLRQDYEADIKEAEETYRKALRELNVRAVRPETVNTSAAGPAPAPRRSPPRRSAPTRGSRPPHRPGPDPIRCL